MPEAWASECERSPSDRLAALTEGMRRIRAHQAHQGARPTHEAALVPVEAVRGGRSTSGGRGRGVSDTRLPGSTARRPSAPSVCARGGPATEWPASP